jgi:hypothetical protein
MTADTALPPLKAEAAAQTSTQPLDMSAELAAAATGFSSVWAS